MKLTELLTEKLDPDYKTSSKVVTYQWYIPINEDDGEADLADMADTDDEELKAKMKARTAKKKKPTWPIFDQNNLKSTFKGDNWEELRAWSQHFEVTGALKDQWAAYKDSFGTEDTSEKEMEEAFKYFSQAT